MRFTPKQCEKEGCSHLPTFIIVDHQHGWMWVACADHEAEKADHEQSCALPMPPVEEP